MARRPSQRQLFRELAAKYGLEIAEAFMAAIADLKRNADFQRVVAALERGDLNGALDALHFDRAAFLGLESKITEAYVAGGQGAVATMPASVSVGFRFNPGAQRAAAWVRAYAAALVTGLTENERDRAREFLADGIVSGRNPRNVAVDLIGRVNRVTRQREGGLIGLSGPQRAYVQAAAQELASGNPVQLRNYLTRGRRDRRFDRAVTASIRTGQPVPADTARVMVQRYADRLTQLRGEVIARTEGLPALRAAKREAFQQLVDDGRVNAQAVTRTWLTSMDGRQRDTHGLMNRQKVDGLDEPFVSPSGARFRYPGDTSLGASTAEIVSCRCEETIKVRIAGLPDV